MSYFLYLRPLTLKQDIEIADEEARHILLSRRIKVGEIITLQDSLHHRFGAKVIAIGKKSVTVHIQNAITPPPEPTIAITLFQALIAEQALDIVLQKATELGASTIALFPAAHSPQHSKNAEKKLERWKKITTEAAKQCDRQLIPNIVLHETIQDIAKLLEDQDQILLLNAEASSDTIHVSNTGVTKIGIIIGPEGGFTETEIAWFGSQGTTQIVKLGPRTLRAETAAISALAIVQNRIGDM